MKFKIHYSIKDYEDFFIIEGGSIEEIQIKAHEEMIRRGLKEGLNSLWSEELE